MCPFRTRSTITNERVEFQISPVGFQIVQMVVEVDEISRDLILQQLGGRRQKQVFIDVFDVAMLPPLLVPD